MRWHGLQPVNAAGADANIFGRISVKREVFSSEKGIAQKSGRQKAGKYLPPTASARKSESIFGKPDT
jgi:hypothetical protein